MFNAESAIQTYQKKDGRAKAIELIADINSWSWNQLRSPKDGPSEEAPPSLQLERSLFDYNEHFIELTNSGEDDRSLMLMILGLDFFIFSAILWFAIIVSADSAVPIRIAAIIWALMIAFLLFNYFLWPYGFGPTFFTALCPRYRFNRTTGKVYVLRPARYGGNAILDWNRVKAHVHWCASREMSWEQLQDPQARAARQANGGGPMMIRGLVLYWPPFDKEDPKREGEDVLWVGPQFSGEGLWQYIRTFMEEGIDAVPVPAHYHWLRKGFSSTSEYVEETALGSFRAREEVTGRSDPAMKAALAAGTVPFSPLHSLGERLCYWPTFPEEWNSDCGQRRRESGIGPEEPLRWAVGPAVVQPGALQP